ncbi:uncharacterized protein LOC128201082 [Galleria mellonella]|uniref:Uncharacterized protein LOC128201082 n=1 Tax=Galleria mellonella TaxID=7137 RepID=A0ABM3MMW2_GALME|nr:uncharacterized protein LOC128201082 [Galleria mellonella]
MSVGKVSEFNVGNGAWSAYVERLNMYFVANEVKPELKLPTLISVMGDEAYELLSNLADPRKPSDLTYKDAVELLRQHLQPTPSVLAERHRFRQRRQGVDENITSYVAELKKLARHCQFKDLEENLRDQLVCGLRSDIIRQRLFAEDDKLLTYHSAVRIATSLEAAERDAAAVELKSAGCEVLNLADDGGAPPVHSMQGRFRRGSHSTRGGQRGGGGRPANTARSGTVGSQTGVNGSGGWERNCRGCGAADHYYTVCRFRDYTCSRCRRIGHLRRVCPERSGSSRRGHNNNTRLYYGEATEDLTRDINTNEEEFHHLCLNDYRAI